MRNLKKILALSLVFALVFSLGFSAIAVSEKKFSDAGKITPQYSSAIDLLVALNVLKGAPATDGSGKLELLPQSNYLRSEMAAMTARLMAGGDDAALFSQYTKASVAAAGKNVYEDVNDADWFAPYVYYLTYMDVVAGYGPDANGKFWFRPSIDANRTEVAKFALGIIGFEAGVQGYIGAAWNLNVLRDVGQVNLFANIAATGTTITREEVFQMLANALNYDVLSYNKSTGKYDKIVTSTQAAMDVQYQTTLEFRFPRYQRIYGTLYANHFARVDDLKTIERNRAYIGSYTIDNIDDMSKAPVSMLGREVMAYAVKPAYTNGAHQGLLSTVVALDSRDNFSLNETATGENKYDANFEKLPKSAPATVIQSRLRFNIGTQDNYSSILDVSGDAWITNNLLKNDTITEAYGYRSIGEDQYSYVFRNLWALAEVTKAADGKVTAVAFNNDENRIIDNKDASSFEGGTDLAVGDIVMVLRKGKDGDSLGDPIAVQMVSHTPGIMTASVFSNKITVGGTQYDIMSSRVIEGNGPGSEKYGYNLYEQITAGGNFAVERNYYIWENSFREDNFTRVVGFRGPGAAADTFCMIIGIDTTGYLAHSTYVKVLKDDNTVGTYKLNSAKAADNATDIGYGALVSLENNSGPVSDSTWVTGGGRGLELFKYSLSDDESSISLVKADKVGATYNLATSVKYSKGDSYIRNPNGTISQRLKDNSITFVKSGSSYYAFKGFDLPGFDSLGGKSVYGLSTDDGSTRWSFLQYEVKTTSDKYALATSGPSYSNPDANGKITLSFSMYNINNGTPENKTYNVVKGKMEDGKDVGSGYNSDIRKGDLIRYTLNAEGEISWFSRVATPDNTALTYSSGALAPTNNWAEMLIAGYKDGNFFAVSSSGGTPTLGLATDGSASFGTNGTIFVDARNMDDVKIINHSDKLLNSSLWNSAVEWSAYYNNQYPLQHGILATGIALASDDYTAVSLKAKVLAAYNANGSAAEIVIITGSSSYAVTSRTSVGSPSATIPSPGIVAAGTYIKAGSTPNDDGEILASGVGVNRVIQFFTDGSLKTVKENEAAVNPNITAILSALVGHDSTGDQIVVDATGKVSEIIFNDSNTGTPADFSTGGADLGGVNIDLGAAKSLNLGTTSGAVTITQNSAANAGVTVTGGEVASLTLSTGAQASNSGTVSLIMEGELIYDEAKFTGTFSLGSGSDLTIEAKAKVYALASAAVVEINGVEYTDGGSSANVTVKINASNTLVAIADGKTAIIDGVTFTADSNTTNTITRTASNTYTLVSIASVDVDDVSGVTISSATDFALDIDGLSTTETVTVTSTKGSALVVTFTLKDSSGSWTASGSGSTTATATGSSSAHVYTAVAGSGLADSLTWANASGTTATLTTGAANGTFTVTYTAP